jgi:hypothetical protein
VVGAQFAIDGHMNYEIPSYKVGLIITKMQEFVLLTIAETNDLRTLCSSLRVSAWRRR